MANNESRQTELLLDPPKVKRAEKPEIQALSVSELVRSAARQVEGLGRVWVEGELTNLRRPGSGHLYFALKDRDAQLPVVMFRSKVKATKAKITEGQLYRLAGKLSIYEGQGRFQLTADHLELAGEGKLLAEIEALKRKLDEEGLFAAAHKKPLPFLPRKIGIVTSRSGAAVRDIIRVLHRRFRADVLLVPASVQGKEAPSEIVNALKRIDREKCDVVIVGRGGGSLEDLMAFNSEDVARTIFSMQTPVVSAVGHEIDHTICDFVADVRAATPSAAAEVVIPAKRELDDKLAHLLHRLNRSQLRLFERKKEQFFRVRDRLASPEALIEYRRQTCDEYLSRMIQGIKDHLYRRREELNQHQRQLASLQPQVRLAHIRAQLNQLKSDAEKNMRSTVEMGRDRIRDLDRRLNRVNPEMRLKNEGHELNRLIHRIDSALQLHLLEYKKQFETTLKRLDALSPLAILARGYSIVKNEEGKVIRKAKDLSVDDHIEITLSSGHIQANVKKIG